ncbi:AcrR family transcriptional regulator [Rhodococcus sp. PvR099]|uniref:TetR/AcrR family transcriptional regulator n=1 Tax=Rhodococcus sp. PvR044 TaxID=3156402 RepID=UPI001B6D3875|nr:MULTISPECIES: TetR/AcrR family transcriptional regulator [Rhodococcus]MBP1160388.1 AcrR family transcriptional regulator [Rhodococcus sp. PvR099]MCZ4556126.1 TetR/AcrR family transcriptional regulator [Rhodococcus maanshanensis]
MDPDAIREQILDAAKECVIELGFTSRLHAAIAQRAGLSRPTVYKYVGDQDAIFGALFQREITQFFVVLDPVLRGQERDLRVGFVDAIVFAVQYARAHPLLQKGLRDDPQVVLPWFTVQAKPFVELGANLLTPHFQRLFTPEQLAEVSPKAISEWAFRIIGSLIVTEGIVDTAKEQSLREFVSSLLSIAFIPAPDPELVRGAG